MKKILAFSKKTWYNDKARALAQLGARHTGSVEATGSSPVCSTLILSVFTAEKPGKPRKYAIFLPFYRIYYSTIFCHRFCHGTYKRDSRLAIYHRKTGRKLKNSMTFSYIFEDNKKTVPLYTAFCLRNTQHQKGSPLWKSLFVLGKVFFVACQSN